MIRWDVMLLDCKRVTSGFPSAMNLMMALALVLINSKLNIGRSCRYEGTADCLPLSKLQIVNTWSTVITCDDLWRDSVSRLSLKIRAERLVCD